MPAERGRIERDGGKFYFVDASDSKWRVHDVGFGPPHAPPFKTRRYDLGSAKATERRFVSADGEQRSYRFAKGEAHGLTIGALTTQLASAEYVGRERPKPPERPW